MQRLIHTALSYLCAILFAASILLSPSNASAMIGCNAEFADGHVHEGHFESGDEGKVSHDHQSQAHEPDGHCPSHACITAILAIPSVVVGLTNTARPGNLLAGDLPGPMSGPEGPLRPPRI